MTKFQVRPLLAADVAALVKLDHSYTTQHVWQMEINHADLGMEIFFRKMRLPRSVKRAYHRPPIALSDLWKERAGILVAELEDDSVVGYIGLELDPDRRTVTVPDLVVGADYRRKGIATGLIIAAMDWTVYKNRQQLIMQISIKNTPAISLARKRGFEMCGYNERLFDNQDIALLYGKGN